MFFLLFAAVFCDGQTATCTNWKFFNLPSPFTSTNPRGINRWGTVVGDAEGTNLSNPVGFIRYSNGTVKTYAVSNGVRTFFTRRNAQGVTIGWADSPLGTDGLVISGSSVVRVNYPAATGTILQGINYWGTIVGIWSNLNPPFSGPSASFEWKNGAFTTIKYPGSVTTNAASISDKGVIVGSYDYYTYNGHHVPEHGFILAKGVYKTLDNPNGGGGTVLNDINASGVIAGTYYHYGFPHGFIYMNGVFKDVKVPNSPSSTLDGINGYGYVTGTAYGSGGVQVVYIAHCQ